ncbi:FAD/NAD(P)-binding domain-containing protein [Violaceomyces palustris]|uniref:FAD/NAD(P)-binding domain-containing protein n=1 Tax=Violaceomyces palustris TaxID=1673888 RepID=A0ACD0P0C4_9BASI|nr:FAD/NAD(P)-binding domain-containing protein [Violaceomyces palustris]
MTRSTVAETRKTIVVLGASYAGHRAIHVLHSLLPKDCRIVVLERNTHANHLYAFPRMSVIEGHEEKVFIPYTNIFRPDRVNRPPRKGEVPAKEEEEEEERLRKDSSRHTLIHCHVEKLDGGRQLVGFKLLSGGDEGGFSSLQGEGLRWVKYDYLIYALGSHLPSPINIWSNIASGGEQLPSGTKLQGVEWLRSAQGRIAIANDIVVVGGGALGVQFSSDIASLYGSSKRVSLIHSRERLLPRFDKWMHDTTVSELERLGVRLLLGSRVDPKSLEELEGDEQEVRTKKIRTVRGDSVEADLVLFCTGQKPNVDLIRGLSSDCLSPDSNMIRVARTLQVATTTETGTSVSEEGLRNVFAIGDAADAFGAINAGHTAWTQAEVAARNLVRLVVRDELLGEKEGSRKDAHEEEEEGRESVENQYRSLSKVLGDQLEEYVAPPPSIKVSLGLHQSIQQTQKGEFFIKSGRTDCKLDLNSPIMWTRRGLSTEDMSI